MPNRQRDSQHRPMDDKGQNKATTQPQKADTNERTPPRKGDPEQVENVPGRQEIKRDRRPDRDETYRTGRQGPR